MSDAMNAEWFGDSYDVVKRFFVGGLRSLGYQVYVDPMPTGAWPETESRFLEFLGARHVREASAGRPALLLDPDTGIAKRRSKKHTTIPDVVKHLVRHELVFVFEQSFSRGQPLLPQLEFKLQELAALGAHGFFYNSHARFLFASHSSSALDTAREAFIKIGLPSHRLLSPPREARRPTWQ